MKNFDEATFIKDWIWFEGPLLSEFELNDKSYLAAWVDVEQEHVWLIIEVTKETLKAYGAKQITFLQVEERSPALFIVKGDWATNEPTPVTFANLREDWKPTDKSFYDEDLMMKVN